jgi:hypothetical protein
MSVRPSAWKNSASTGQIFLRFGTCSFFESLWRKFKFHYNLTTITGTLHEYQYTFLIISRLFLLRMRHILFKNCRENQNTHFCLNFFFSKTAPFMRQCGKIRHSRLHVTDGDMAHAYCLLDV